jgi:hypothetical protein
MKKLMLTICLVLGLVIMAAPALANNFAIGDPIIYTLSNSVSADGWGSGGLFTITDTNGGPSIQTFCLELNEHINNGDVVGSISGVAINGGRYGGSPDPISPATGWLYAQFIAGNPAYSSREALQIAFWILENEVSDGEASAWFNAGFLATAQGYVNDANSNAVAGNYYGTQVLNLNDAAGNPAQSELIHVPEPSILILLGIAMSAIGAASWRLRKL